MRRSRARLRQKLPQELAEGKGGQKWFAAGSPIVRAEDSPLRTAPRTSGWEHGATRGPESLGGTHLTVRVPCCWNWHSSRLHKSMAGLWARRWSFFISPLSRGVRLGHDRPGFAESEVQTVENPLALSSAQVNPAGPIQMVSEQLAIPEVLRVAELAGRLPQVAVRPRQLRRRESGRATQPFAFLLPGETVLLKSGHPTLHRGGVLPQPIGRLVTVEAMADEQQAVQAMVVARFRRAKNLLLQTPPA